MVPISVPSGGFTREIRADFMRSRARVLGKAAARFFHKMLKAKHTHSPRVINVEQNAAAPKAVETLQQEETLAKTVELQHNKYLNNVVELSASQPEANCQADDRKQDRSIVPGVVLRAIAALNMIHIGQVSGITQGSSVSPARFVEELFGIIA